MLVAADGSREKSHWKHPLMPHNGVGSVGGCYGNLGCSGSGPGRPPVAPSLNRKREGSYLFAFWEC